MISGGASLPLFLFQKVLATSVRYVLAIAVFSHFLKIFCSIPIQKEKGHKP